MKKQTLPIGGNNVSGQLLSSLGYDTPAPEIKSEPRILRPRILRPVAYLLGSSNLKKLRNVQSFKINRRSG